MRVLIIASLILALIIVMRFAFIMLGSNRDNQAPAKIPSPAERGLIVDRKGRLIALQNRLWSVTAWKPELEDPLQSAAILAEILKKDPERIAYTLTGATSSRFVFIKRQITPTESDAIRTLIDAGKLPGISLQEELGRHYPMKELAAPLIGYVGIDNSGLDGIEYAFNRVLAPGDMSDTSEKVYGHTVHLTLDMSAQYLVEHIAEEAWELHKPDSMMILVMEAKSAEILCWVSLPGFDPNTFENSSRNHRMNRPLIESYEPGSVFKIFTWATLLESEKVKPTDIFDTSGGYEPEIFRQYSIQPITDLKDHGKIDFQKAIVYSSNVAVAMASEAITKNAFYSSLKNFGFGSPTGIPLPGESHGILNPTSVWSPRSQPTISFGHEVGVSALQIITAATTFTNGGVLLQPRIVSKVSAADGSIVKQYTRKAIREVISPKTARIVLNAMEQAVADPSGTARLATVPGLRIAAKSGTAQITDPETGTYSEDRFTSSALAIFPVEDPQLIVYVVLDTPKGDSIYGAQTAAPIIRDIAKNLAPIRGIPLEGNTTVDYRHFSDTGFPEPAPLGNTLHDMTGYSKRMLLPYLARKDIQWNISGEGWVVFQFPPPGTAIEEGMSVFLELE